MNKKIIYITGNKFKVLTANNILNPLGIDVEAKKIDCPEIQADLIEDVAKYSSKYASNLLEIDTLKNDSGLVIPSLGGFPGPYTHYVEDTIGEDGILKLMINIEDRTAYFVEVLAYTEYEKEPVVFISKTEGTIAHEKSGDYGWSYDKIFIPKGHNKTLASFPDDERWKLWDDTAYSQLVDYLKEKEERKAKIK